MDSTRLNGLIIAGGRSTRMGQDKAMLTIGGLSLLAYIVKQTAALCDLMIISAADEQRVGAYRMAMEQELPELTGRLGYVTDTYSECGPLTGLHAGLSALPSGYALVLACDMPIVSQALTEKLAERADGFADVIHVAGEPFHALYHTRSAIAAGKLLLEGDYRLMGLLRRLKSIELSWSCPAEKSPFQNLNTPQDYKRYVEFID